MNEIQLTALKLIRFTKFLLEKHNKNFMNEIQLTALKMIRFTKFLLEKHNKNFCK